jgi:hypothetical protein
MMAYNPDLAGTSDDDLVAEIHQIEENLKETGSKSSYYKRNQPVLRVLYIEAEDRGLDLEP